MPFFRLAHRPDPRKDARPLSSGVALHRFYLTPAVIAAATVLGHSHPEPLIVCDISLLILVHKQT